MVQRVGILNGENITYDKDFAAYFFSLAETGVYEGLEVQSGRILQGKAIITITRTNGEKAAIFFENTESIQIDTSGNNKIFISFDEQKINFGQSNNEDGTGIANITSAPNYPTKNFLPLASITNGQITDERIWVTLRDDLIGRKIYKKSETYNKSQITEMLAGVNSFAGKTKVNPGEDLNNIKNPGLYYNPGNWESDQILNHPKRQFDGHLHNLEQSAFGLLVYEASGVIQELTIYNLRYKFIRRFYDNNWSAWRVLYVDGTLNLGNTDKHNIAIGDSDTGFRQDGDGRLEMFCNNQKIFKAEHNFIEFNKTPFTTQPQHSAGSSLTRKDYVDNRCPKIVFSSSDNLNYGATSFTLNHNISDLNENNFYNGKYSIRIFTDIGENLFMWERLVYPIKITWSHGMEERAITINNNSIKGSYYGYNITSKIKKIIIVQNYF